MCNRYSFHTDPMEMLQQFRVVQDRLWHETNPDLTRNYNVAPTSTMPVIRNEDGQRVLDGMRWGLVPAWATDIKIGTKALNARSDTLAEKRMFRSAYKSRRCLIPASGYYEWQTSLTGKQPFHIHLPEYTPFAFAGLWEHWWEPGGPQDGTPLLSYTIITTDPNQQLAHIHNRMPVILAPEDQELWLDPTAKREDLQPLLRPYPNGELIPTPVHSRVGSVKYKEPDCITPLPAVANIPTLTLEEG